MNMAVRKYCPNCDTYNDPGTSKCIKCHTYFKAKDIEINVELIGLGKKLNKKVAQSLESAKHENEEVLFCLVGYSYQTIAVLNTRLIIIKPGFAAGSTGGCRTSSFSYKDITSIETNTGLKQGVIEICTPSYQGSKTKDYWSKGDNSPFHISNCVPTDKRQLRLFKPYLDRINKMVLEAKGDKQISQVSISDELEKLAKLLESGILSKAEFTKAKNKLLDS